MRKKVGKSSRSNSSEKFSAVTCSGNQVGGTRRISFSDFTEPKSIQTNGPIITTMPTARTAYSQAGVRT